jgi:hypothetical protein
MLKNGSKHHFEVVLRCSTLLWQSFAIFNFMSILVDFLLSRRFFERVGGVTSFLDQRVGAVGGD